MRRALLVVLVVALGALIFAPAAFAQDDNPTGDDLGGDDRGDEHELRDETGRTAKGAEELLAQRLADG